MNWEQILSDTLPTLIPLLTSFGVVSQKALAYLARIANQVEEQGKRQIKTEETVNHLTQVVDELSGVVHSLVANAKNNASVPS